MFIFVIYVKNMYYFNKQQNSENLHYPEEDDDDKIIDNTIIKLYFFLRLYRNIKTVKNNQKRQRNNNIKRIKLELIPTTNKEEKGIKRKHGIQFVKDYYTGINLQNILKTIEVITMADFDNIKSIITKNEHCLNNKGVVKEIYPIFKKLINNINVSYSIEKINKFINETKKNQYFYYFIIQ